LVVKVCIYQPTLDYQQKLPLSLNSGTLTLILNPGDFEFPDDFDQGRVWVQYASSTHRIEWNGWEEESDGTWTWDMYFSQSVQAVWIDTFPYDLIVWTGFGPWEAAQVGYTYSGIHKTGEVTEINFTVEEPIFRDWTGIGNPTVDWPVTAEPAWAVESYAQSGDLNFKVETSCSGFGDNHAGLFKWQTELATENTFGNGIFREHLLEPLVLSTWTLSRPDGTILASGDTLAPLCAESILRLPLIMK